MSEGVVSAGRIQALSLGRNGQEVIVTLFLALVSLIIITPAFLLFLSSFQVGAPGEPTVYGLEGWRVAFTTPGILQAIYNSFSLAITRQSISLVVGILIAWLLARTDLPMRGTLEFMFWLSFFLPSLPVALGWILLLAPNYGLLNQLVTALPFIDSSPFNIYSYWGIVWVHLTATTLAIKVMLLTPAFRNLDAALEESARVIGAGPFQVLFGIIVPIMMPIILVSVILGLMRSLEAFEIELILGVPIGLHVFSTKIHEFLTNEPTQFPEAAALGGFFLVVLLVLVAFQRLYLGRRVFTTVTGRGFSSRRIALGRWKYPIFGVVLLIALTITVVPTVFVTIGTFMKLFGFFAIEEPWTIENWRQALSDPTLMMSFKNTLLLGLWTAGIVVFLGGFIAYVIVKSRFRLRAAIDFISWLPWAIPGILIGMGVMLSFLFLNPFIPLYGTLATLVVAMVINSMPLSVQVIKSFLMQIGDELEEASRVSGGSWVQTYFRILLPLLFPCLVVVGLLAFISAVRNISSVVLLGTAQTRTLSLLMLDFAAGAEVEKATVVAVIIVLMVVGAAVVARAVGGQLSVRG